MKRSLPDAWSKSPPWLVTASMAPELMSVETESRYSITEKNETESEKRRERNPYVITVSLS